MAEKAYYTELRNQIWHLDPGYLRLKHAAKTIVAILFVLWLVKEEPLFTKTMAGLACGFSMQGIDAKSFSSRLTQVLIFNLIYFLVFALGLLIRDSSDLTTIVLIVLGFSVNYMRRFQLENSIAPMMAWLLCFCATILPYGSTLQAWQHIHGLVAGLVVSAIAVGFIFPENYPQLFVKNSNQLFYLLAKGMNNMRGYLVTRKATLNFEKQDFVQIKRNLHNLLDSNQTIEESNVFNSHQAMISSVMMHQYALVSTYSMMIDAYRVLKIHHFQLSRPLCLMLAKLNRQYSVLFYTLRMNKNYDFSASARHLSLQKLSEILSHETLTEPTLIMVLLNLKLSMILINEHVSALLRGNDVS